MLYLNWSEFDPLGVYVVLCGFGRSGKPGLGGGRLQIYALPKEYGQPAKLIEEVSGPKAIWSGKFSSDGRYFGFHDSVPVTFYLEREYEFVKRGDYEVRDRSFSCFHPNNAWAALSSHAYHAISVGGLGWLFSSDVWLQSIRTKKDLMTVKGHHGKVKKASFTSDGTTMVSIDDAGVVLVTRIAQR